MAEGERNGIQLPADCIQSSADCIHVPQASVATNAQDEHMSALRRASGPVAIQTLLEVARGKKNQASARVSAARTLAEIAGLLQEGKRPPAAKELQEMTADQLRAFVDSAEATLAARSKDITPPVRQPTS